MRKLTTLCGALLIGVSAMTATNEMRFSTGVGTPAAGTPVFSIAGNANQHMSSQGGNFASSGVYDLLKGRQSRVKPMKVGDNGAEIYGWLIWSSPMPASYAGLGFGEVKTDGTFNPYGFGFMSGWNYPGFFIRNGKACTVAAYEPNQQVVAYAYLEYDIATGAEETMVEIPMSSLNGTEDIFQMLAYDANADMVYGYSHYNSLHSGTAISLIKLDPKNPSKVMQIADVPRSNRCLCLTWNQDEDELVGINESNEFVIIDRLTGKQTVKATLDIGVSRWLFKTGLCWSPKDGKYLWQFNTNTEPERSELWTIDPKTYEVEKIATFPRVEEFVSLVCTDRASVGSAAPKDAIFKSFNFVNGDLTGSLVYTMPTQLGDNTPIMGNIDYVLEVDGNVYKKGVAAAGSDVTINFEELEEALHKFKMTLSVKGVEGRGLLNTYFVGNDTPLAPANVKMENEHISWDPVTKGMYNGYINAANMIYNVYVNDRLVGRNLKTTTYEYKFPDNAELAQYRVQVEAMCNDKVSELSPVATCVYGQPLSIPTYIQPAQEQESLFTVIDANNDGTKFGWYGYINDKGYMWIDTNVSQNTNDWVILPPVYFPSASNVYNFSLQAATRKEGCSEWFEVYIGDEPTVEAMTTQVMGRTNVTQKDFTEFSSVIKVNSPGAKYIGIRCVSMPRSFRLYVRDFTINNSAIDQNAPDAPQDVTFTYGANGTLNATVAFTMPTKALSGATLSASETLKALVSCSESGQSKEVTGFPGDRLTVTVPAAQGNNFVCVEVSNAHGTGAPASANVYCGLDVPGAAENFKIFASEDNNNAILTWQPPKTGLHGGYVSPKGISYWLARYNTMSQGFEVSEALGTDVGELELDLPDNLAQQVGMFGIVAGNAAGQSTKVAGGSVLVGKPYTLPMREEFANGALAYTPFIGYQPNEDYSTQLNWNTKTPASAGSKYAMEDGVIALIGTTPLDHDKGRFGIPKFSTVGAENPSCFIQFYVGGCQDLEVFANGYDVAEPVSLGKVSQKNLPEGYQTIEFKLPAQFKNRKWVELFVDATFTSKDQVCIIPSYVIKDSQAQDLGVTALTGTQAALIDNVATYKATVTNEGYEAISFRGGKWTLTTAAGTVVATQDVPADAAMMKPGEKKEFTFSFTPDANMAGNMAVKFELNGADMNVDNDSMSLKLSVGSGSALVVTDLRAMNSDGTYVDLAWTDPVISDGVESFEKEPAFVITNEIAGFRNIDRDEAVVVGLTGAAPYPNQGMPSAFTVWDPNQLKEEARNRYQASAGRQFIAAFVPDPSKGKDVAADDWLISPAIAGGTEVAFDIKALTYQYGAEEVEVLYSSTDREPESFKLVEKIKLDGPASSTPVWATKIVNMPNDAKYFAIHYVSYDCLGIFIDNLQWTPQFAGLRVTGYDIYRNNAPIAEAAAVFGGYRDANIPSASDNYSYYVVPVLNNGQKGMKSNVITVQPSGVEDIIAADGKVFAGKGFIAVNGCEGGNVIVYTADGKTVVAKKNVSAAETYNVEPGVYMVMAGGKNYKVIVK